MLSMMFSSGIASGVVLNYKLWEITTLCWGQQLQSGEILDHSPPHPPPTFSPCSYMAKFQMALRVALFLRILLDVITSITFWRGVWETGV